MQIAAQPAAAFVECMIAAVITLPGAEARTEEEMVGVLLQCIMSHAIFKASSWSKAASASTPLARHARNCKPVGKAACHRLSIASPLDQTAYVCLRAL